MAEAASWRTDIDEASTTLRRERSVELLMLLQIATLLHMATTSPARIDDDLYASAKLAGSVQSRSASQQVAHWARIGREIEASSSIAHKEIAAVLAGSRSYDSLGAKEQAVVRAEWAERMEEVRGSLDLAAQFSKAGRTWVELDDKGRVAPRGSSKEPAAKKVTAKKAAASNAAKPKKSTGGRSKVRAAR